MHGPLLFYRWSKDHGLLISSEKGVKKKRIPTSWVMHAQDQHGSGLESVMFWLQRINFYILKKEREKGIALVLKAKISGWQEAATCIYGMDRMIGRSQLLQRAGRCFCFLFLFCSVLIIRENMVVEIIRVIMVQGWVASLAFWGCYFSFPSALRSVALFGWQDSFFAIWWCCCLLKRIDVAADWLPKTSTVFHFLPFTFPLAYTSTLKSTSTP